MKYKVGDKVRIRRDLQGDKKYAGCYFNPSMAKYCGKFVTIDYVFTDTGYFTFKECGGWQWSYEMLEKVDEMNISITSSGSIVTAQMGDKYGVAKCSPDDEFDIFVGAKLALERLEKQCKPYAWLKKWKHYYIPDIEREGLFSWRECTECDYDKRMMERGLVFKTEEEAVAVAKKMLEVLKESDSNDND